VHTRSAQERLKTTAVEEIGRLGSALYRIGLPLHPGRVAQHESQPSFGQHADSRF
jgi:hypothetical protein